MAIKPWSLSTTVRNPERVRNFLWVLAEYFEGKEFHKDNQKQYQARLIQHRFYEPMHKNLSRGDIQHLNSNRPEIPYEVAKRIFENKNYQDPSMRGRNSVAPLNKMGLCLAKQSEGPVRISPLGKQLLEGEIELKEVMRNFFYKWELPNPAESRSFSARDGFCIKPFRATLEIINKVNQKWNEQGNSPVGVSREEFNLFISTTVHHEGIDDSVKRLLEFRKEVRSRDKEGQREYVERYTENFTKQFFDVTGEDQIKRKSNNLRDYGDNARRYLHLTGFFVFRGKGRFFDLSPYRSVEINKLLESTSPAPRGFDSQSEYLAFLRDPASFEVPWKVQESLLEIWSDISSHIENIKKKLKEQGLNYPEINLLEKFPTENPDKLSIENLERLIERGREYRSNLLEIQEQKKLYDPEEFEKVIESLENIYDLNDKAMWFEHYITLSLKAFNEAKKITGNYPVDDENQPMCHAPGNMPDIVGNYESFDLICEVTLLTSRDQWYNEGQPVQRHIKDHMDKHGKETYSFFIAPVLHRDTVNQFWSGIRHEYEGAPLKIYPMTTDEFIGLMRTDLELRRNDDRVSRKEFQVFLDERFSKEKLEAARNVEEWMDGNRKQMSEWLQTQTERVS